MDFQNDSSANMFPLYFLYILTVIKFPHHLFTVWPYPSINFVSYWDKTANHIFRICFHLTPTSPKTAWTTDYPFSWNSVYSAYFSLCFHDLLFHSFQDLLLVIDCQFVTDFFANLHKHNFYTANKNDLKPCTN